MKRFGLLSSGGDCHALNSAMRGVVICLIEYVDELEIYGPGHNSFTVDENGNAVFVYHARSEECYKNQCQWSSASSLYDPCRHARVKRVHWAADGTPILNMSYEEELNDAYKNVTVRVTVEDNSGEEELALIENPKNYVGKIGETTEFTVKATGEGLTYQWEYCNASSNKWRTSSMEGNQTDTIKVEAGSWRNGQKYRCVIKDAEGNTLTSEASKAVLLDVVLIYPIPWNPKPKIGVNCFETPTPKVGRIPLKKAL